MAEVDLKFVVLRSDDAEPSIGLLLGGLAEAPADARFSVLPASDSAAIELGPQPEDLVSPCSVTRTPDGVVLGVGDHVGELSRLKPGQTVVVEVPGVGVRTIAEWPGLAQRVAAPVAPSAATDADDRAVAEDADGLVAAQPLALALAETLRRMETTDAAVDEDEGAAQASGASATVSRLRPPASAIKLEEAQQRLSSIVSRIMSYEPPQPEPPKAPPAVPPPMASVFRPAEGKMSAAEMAASIAAAAAMRDAAAESLADPDVPTRDSDARLDSPANDDRTLAETAASADDSKVRPDPLADSDRESDQPPQRRDYPIAKYRGDEVPVDVVGRRMSMAAIILAACSAVVVVIGVMWISLQARQVSLAAADRGAVRLAGGSAEGSAGSGAGGSLSDVFAIGSTSPLGRTRRDVSLDAGLALADQALSKAQDGDRSEGEYWLKHALSLALGDERIRWALTQLGSGYAGGNGEKPDYAKARILWEIAGQLGDPVALCFLGTLYEHGLGLPADKPLALSWYARAKQAGGCPGIDASMARVRQ